MGFLFGRKARHAKVRVSTGARGHDLDQLDPLATDVAPDEELVTDHWLAGPIRETGIPRWRRQSLIAARKSIPMPGQAMEPLRFGREFAEDVEGLERRLVRYRLVRLLDLPDEVRGREIDVLDSGDEVAILERHGMFCRVLCPDFSEGWIHRMTLGELAPPMEAAAQPAESDPVAEGASGGDVADLPGFPDELVPDTFEDLLRAAHDGGGRGQEGDALEDAIGA